MKLHITVSLAALVCGGLLAGPAQAARKPTIAIMPAQFYSADAQSARQITDGLRGVYERQGYTVLSAERSGKTFRDMKLGRSHHDPDRTAVRFGRKMGADLVAYPRLLAVGLPMTETRKSRLAPEAVLHLRVLNAHSGKPIYFRQVAHPFTPGGTGLAGDYKLPRNAASRTAAKATSGYFNRVSGSGKENRGR
ncbi:MAG: hypothetical protein K0Q72_5203 [Armatimonadetes bacterium]|nr:hypothetical protein [Armatimonadota bacterium]